MQPVLAGLDGRGWYQQPGSNNQEENIPMAAEFELYKDKAGEFRWRLQAENNEIIADSAEG